MQNEVAEMAFALSDNKPCIIVVCYVSIDSSNIGPFPTIIKTTGYTPPALEAAAAVIFGDNLQSQLIRFGDYSGANPQQPGVWPVEQWNEARDVSRVLHLWTECVSSRFAMDQQTFASILRRPGYAKHYGKSQSL